jgi:MoaD family protein
MTRVRVRYCAQARTAAGVEEEDVALENACALADLLVKVAKAHGETLSRVLLGGNDRPHPSLLLFVDGEQVSVNAPQALKDGDIIDIVPPMSGG